MKASVINIEKLWLSNKEAQAYVGMSSDFFKDLRASGQLRFFKVGGAVFYRKGDIDRLIERGRVV